MASSGFAAPPQTTIQQWHSNSEYRQERPSQIAHAIFQLCRPRPRTEEVMNLMTNDDDVVAEISEWESEESEPLNKLQQKRKPTEKKPKKAPVRKLEDTNQQPKTNAATNETPEKRCSEVLFPNTVLMEEVKSYISQNQNSLTDGEKEYLEKWMSQVQVRRTAATKSSCVGEY